MKSHVISAPRRGSFCVLIVAAVAIFAPSLSGQWPFIRGDANVDGQVDLGDAISILDRLFGGGPMPCAAAMDSNDDDGVDIADAIYLLSYLFSGGSAPPDPFRACGDDPPTGSLDCAGPVMSCLLGLAANPGW